jgi:hypothetical protein
MIGFGDHNAHLNVYIDKLPPMDQWQSLDFIESLTIQQINEINQACGNGWRKVFNIYAKLMYALEPASLNSWQEYRDLTLLTENSDCALLHQTAEDFVLPDKGNPINVIMGKQFGTAIVQNIKINQNITVYLLSESGDITQPFDTDTGTIPSDFSLLTFDHGVALVCPYFDYRQLSNVKLTQLVNIIKTMRQNGYT